MEKIKKRKNIFWTISFLILLVTTLTLLVLLIKKPKTNKESLFTLSWSITLTIIILLAGAFIINQKITKIIWTINIVLGVIVGNKIGMIIVLAIYLIYDLLFGLYENYKLKLTIHREIKKYDA